MRARFKFNLQFFGGGGGSSSKQYRKRDPEPQELIDLRNQLVGKISPMVDMFDVNDWAKARDRANNALEQQGNMISQLPGMISQQGDMISRLPGMISQQSDIISQLPGMISQIPEQNKRNQALLDEMMGVVRTGNVPSALIDNANASVNKGLKTGMGSMLDSLGTRGVLNSSITSRGINDLSQRAADAMNANYLNAYNSVLNGYSQGLQGAANESNALINGINAVSSGINAAGNGANTLINGINALGDRTNTLINGINALGNIPSQQTSGVTNMLMPGYNMWKDWQNMYYGHEDYDTVVKQGK